MTNIIINDEYTVALLPGARAAVSTDVKSLSRPTLEIDRLASTRNLLFWGDNNDFPQSVINNVRKDPEIGTLLDKQAALLYSGGISWGIPSKVNGKVIYTDLSPNEDKVIRQWYKKSNINKYIAETAKDLYWFYNAFTEVVLDGGGTSIIQLCAQPAEECRFGPQNANSGMIDTCYLNAQWPNGTPTDPLTKKLPVLDIYYDPSQQLLANQRGLNYIYPLSIANPGNKFYQLASWNSIIESGWLDISQAIPKFKKALLKNQMTVKYHIQISNLFWDLKYPDFRDKKDMKKRKEIMLAELTALEATLTGAERAGKSITSGLFHQENTQTAKEYELVKITPIDDLMKDGKCSLW